MPEVTQRNIRVPVPNSSSHSEHTVRTVNVSKDEGVKALYCMDCKKIFTYLYAKNKDWNLSKAKKHIADQTEKIEKVKELLVYDEYTLNEIAFHLGYSSVQHLSNQFKKVTGLSPSHFKKIKEFKRKPLDEV